MTKAILITGAAARIGCILARGLADDGWAVAVHYNRSAKPARALAEELGGNSAAVGANLNVPSERDSLIARASAALGTPLTALINNASTFAPDEVDSFSAASFDHHMDVNLKAAVMLSQQFVAALPNSENGTIINMIDQRVFRPAPDYFTYSLSKAGLLAATKTMAQALAPRVRVCGIGPGATLQNTHQSQDDFNAEIKASLSGEGSPPETILHAARYLLSASAVTGQMIAVDGGEHLIF